MYADNIKSITLVLENCDEITIPRKFICDLDFLEFQRKMQRDAMNSISVNESYDFVAFSVFADFANEPVDKNSMFYSETWHNPTPYEKLVTRRDVTQIHINHTEGNEKENFWFFPRWEVENPNSYSEDNKLMSIEFNKHGFEGNEKANDVLIIIAEDSLREKHSQLIEGLKENMDPENMAHLYELYN